MPLEKAAGYGRVYRNVVNDHDAPPAYRRAINALFFLDSRSAYQIRDIDGKRRSDAETAFHGYCAALEVYHALTDGHTEAASGRSATVRALLLRVRFEEVADEVLAYADAGIRHLKVQDRRFFVHHLLRGNKRHSASGFCKLICV